MSYLTAISDLVNALNGIISEKGSSELNRSLEYLKANKGSQEAANANLATVYNVVGGFDNRIWEPFKYIFKNGREHRVLENNGQYFYKDSPTPKVAEADLELIESCGTERTKYEAELATALFVLKLELTELSAEKFEKNVPPKVIELTSEVIKETTVNVGRITASPLTGMDFSLIINTPRLASAKEMLGHFIGSKVPSQLIYGDETKKNEAAKFPTFAEAKEFFAKTRTATASSTISALKTPKKLTPQQLEPFQKGETKDRANSESSISTHSSAGSKEHSPANKLADNIVSPATTAAIQQKSFI